jgi:hypothetical protein
MTEERHNSRAGGPQDVHFYYFIPPLAVFYQRQDIQEHLQLMLVMKFPESGFYIVNGDEVMPRTERFMVGGLDEDQDIPLPMGVRVVPPPKDRIDEIFKVLSEFDDTLYHRKRVA